MYIEGDFPKVSSTSHIYDQTHRKLPKIFFTIHGKVIQRKKMEGARCPFQERNQYLLPRRYLIGVALPFILQEIIFKLKQ